MSVIDKIPFNPDHRWEITKISGMFHVIAFDNNTGEVLTNAADDTLSTAMCCVYNRLRMIEAAD